MPTPFSKLNWILGGGMRAGEIYILCGKEGSGKTSLVLQFAMAALRKGHSVLIFSMEMSCGAVYQRMVGIEARVDLHSFAHDQRWKVDVGEEMARLCRATAMMSGWKLLVSTKPRVTPQYISTEINRIAKRSTVDLIIIDHAQLMDAEGPTRSEYERMTKVSRALKAKADARGPKRTRYMVGPVKTLLKVAKNRYGIQGAYVALNHYKSETQFEPVENGDADGE